MTDKFDQIMPLGQQLALPPSFVSVVLDKLLYGKYKHSFLSKSIGIEP